MVIEFTIARVQRSSSLPISMIAQNNPRDDRWCSVMRGTTRIASFPAHAVAHVKAAVDAGAFSSMAEGLLVEAHESDLSVVSEVTQARVTEALKVGAETYEGELEMDYLSRLSPIR
jgi:hypothetical protein